MNNNYLDYDCKNCGRHRVEINGICEKCNYDNIENEYAKPINDCLEYGAGSCRNADLIDKLRAELARLTAELEREKDNRGKFYLAIDKLRAELARLTAELEREKDNCGKFYLALEKIYDALGMDDHTGSCIPEIDRLTEQVARLKEDAIRLASTYVIEVFPHEWVCRGGCHHWARFGEQIEHSPDCPITLHRALMKELE